MSVRRKGLRGLTEAVVAFIDVLGFKGRVNAITSVAELIKAADDLAHLQYYFGHTRRDKRLRDSNRITATTVLAFSDCLVIAFGLRSQIVRLEGSFDPLLSHLSQLTLCQAECVARGVFLRGGIDVGFWLRRKDLVISPALVAAYELEQHVSVPVISLSGRLYHGLRNHPHQRFYANSPTKELFATARHPDPTTHQWIYFLDYLKITFDSVDGIRTPEEREIYRRATSDEEKQAVLEEVSIRHQLEWLNAHRDAIAAAYSSAPDDRARGKCHWLAKYHNNFLRRIPSRFKEARVTLPNGGGTVGPPPA